MPGTTDTPTPSNPLGVPLIADTEADLPRASNAAFKFLSKFLGDRISAQGANASSTQFVRGDDTRLGSLDLDLTGKQSPYSLSSLENGARVVRVLNAPSANFTLVFNNNARVVENLSGMTIVLQGVSTPKTLALPSSAATHIAISDANFWASPLPIVS